MDDIEIPSAFGAEGRYVGIVPCQPFMPRPPPKIVHDCIRRDRPLPQAKRVRRQFGSCLPCLHLGLYASAAVRYAAVGTFASFFRSSSARNQSCWSDQIGQPRRCHSWYASAAIASSLTTSDAFRSVKSVVLYTSFLG